MFSDFLFPIDSNECPHGGEHHRGSAADSQQCESIPSILLAPVMR